MNKATKNKNIFLKWVERNWVHRMFDDRVIELTPHCVEYNRFGFSVVPMKKVYSISALNKSDEYTLLVSEFSKIRIGIRCGAYYFSKNDLEPSSWNFLINEILTEKKKQ